jgi:chromosome segregation ATPase
MKSSEGIGPVLELKQLLRLRQVRVDAAEAKVREQRTKCETIEGTIEQCMKLIETDRQQMAEHASHYNAFRDRLGAKLEDDEYKLIALQEDLEKAQKVLYELRQAWLREQSRQDGVQEALKRSRKAVAQQRDVQTENEADELRCTGPVPCPASTSNRVQTQTATEPTIFSPRFSPR